MEKREFKGVWIPKEIYLNTDLNWTDKILLIEIDSLDVGEGCFASNAYLANFLNVTETTISKSISKLKELGFIELTSFDGRKRVLKAAFKFTTRQTLSSLQGSLVPNLKQIIDIDNTVIDNTKISNKKINNTTTKSGNSLTFSINKFSKQVDIIQGLFSFIEHFKEVRKHYPSSVQFEKMLDKLHELSSVGGEFNSKFCSEIINYTVTKGWLDFYEVDELKNKYKTQTKGRGGKQVDEEF